VCRGQFTIANRGIAGEEVPQVYLGEPATKPPGAQFAVKVLAGFDRIKLESGQSREITLEVSKRDLCYWSTTAGCWTKAKGVRTVYVGSSSRDLSLAADIIVG
jgi:beta-glucosidase